MCEPLSVGVHAVRRGQVSPGMDVAVIGAGPIGEPARSLIRAPGAVQHRAQDVTTRHNTTAQQQSVCRPPSPFWLKSCCNPCVASALHC
jgi:L-iditol 2-dehydrogenase